MIDMRACGAAFVKKHNTPNSLHKDHDPRYGKRKGMVASQRPRASATPATQNPSPPPSAPPPEAPKANAPAGDAGGIRASARQDQLRQLAVEFGYDPNKIKYVDKNPPRQISSVIGAPIGATYATDGSIVVYRSAFDVAGSNAGALRGFVAHEIVHHKWSWVSGLYRAGDKRIQGLLDPYMRDVEKLRKGAGFSDYAKMFWGKAERGGDRGIDHAINETLGEARGAIEKYGVLAKVPQVYRKMLVAVDAAYAGINK